MFVDSIGEKKTKSSACSVYCCNHMDLLVDKSTRLHNLCQSTDTLGENGSGKLFNEFKNYAIIHKAS